jgi:hypothetical protein
VAPRAIGQGQLLVQLRESRAQLELARVVGAVRELGLHRARAQSSARCARW